MAKQETIKLGLLPVAALLTSCDPGVHLAWQDKFDRQIDRKCVENAGKFVAGKITISGYTSDGHPFPQGLTVYQINYGRPFNEKMVYASAGYRIDIATLSDGSTGYYHAWGKLGVDVSRQERDYVVPFMAKVNEAVATQCGLSVGNGSPSQGDF